MSLGQPSQRWLSTLKDLTKCLISRAVEHSPSPLKSIAVVGPQHLRKSGRIYLQQATNISITLRVLLLPYMSSTCPRC